MSRYRGRNVGQTERVFLNVSLKWLSKYWGIFRETVFQTKTDHKTWFISFPLYCIHKFRFTNVHKLLLFFFFFIQTKRTFMSSVQRRNNKRIKSARTRLQVIRGNVSNYGVQALSKIQRSCPNFFTSKVWTFACSFAQMLGEFSPDTSPSKFPDSRFDACREFLPGRLADSDPGSQILKFRPWRREHTIPKHQFPAGMKN